MLQRVVLNRPGPCSAVSAASVLTPVHRLNSQLLWQVFSSKIRIVGSHDTNFTRLRANATARQANPHELTRTISVHSRHFAG